MRAQTNILAYISLFGKIELLRLRCKINIYTPYKIFPKTFKSEYPYWSNSRVIILYYLDMSIVAYWVAIASNQTPLLILIDHDYYFRQIMMIVDINIFMSPPKGNNMATPEHFIL